MAVDHDKELDLEDLEIEEVGSGQPRGGVLAEDDLEQYGVWVKVKPHTVGEKPESNRQEPRLESLNQEFSPGDEGLTEEEEQLLGSLEEGGPVEPPEFDDLGELSIPEEEDLGALEPEGEQVEVPLSEDPASGERFDDLASLEEELAAAPPSPAGQTPRTQVLQKIEEELAAIRGELAALKSELVNLRRPGPEIEAGPAETEREAGFFTDDSDETIALTGDELDNILNTAEITEEEASVEPVVEEPMEILVAEPEAQADSAIEPLEVFALDEPIEEAPALDSQAMSLDFPEEAGESIELELPDIEEIGFDTLEGPVEALLEEPAEAGSPEPLEELEIDLTDDAAEQPAETGLDALEEMALVEEALEPELPSEEMVLTPVEDEELVLDVPEEVSAELEPLETLEAFELDDTAGGVPAEAEEEIALDFPELELPEDNEGGAPLEELSLDIPDEEIAEAAVAAPPEAETLASIEPAEQEADELEEIGAAEEVEELAVEEPGVAAPAAAAKGGGVIPSGLKDEIRSVLKYMDQLLENLPDDKIEEFANSEYFEVYRRLFEELGIA